MKQSKAQVLKAALALPIEQQHDLLDELEAHLNNGVPFDDPEFEAELERRYSDYKAGRTKAYSTKEVIKELNQLVKSGAKRPLGARSKGRSKSSN